MRPPEAPPPPPEEMRPPPPIDELFTVFNISEVFLIILLVMIPFPEI